MKTAREIMTRDVFSVTEEQTVNFLEILMEYKHIRHIPVASSDSKKLVGMVSVRDVVHYYSKAGMSHFVPVRNIMSTDIISASPEESVAEIAKIMREKNVSAVIISDGQEMIGLVTDRDFLKLH